jgi:hypothetical protein
MNCGSELYSVEVGAQPACTGHAGIPISASVREHSYEVCAGSTH